MQQTKCLLEGKSGREDKVIIGEFKKDFRSWLKNYKAEKVKNRNGDSNK